MHSNERVERNANSWICRSFSVMSLKVFEKLNPDALRRICVMIFGFEFQDESTMLEKKNLDLEGNLNCDKELGVKDKVCLPKTENKISNNDQAAKLDVPKKPSSGKVRLIMFRFTHELQLSSNDPASFIFKTSVFFVC